VEDKTHEAIRGVCRNMGEFLVEKNIAYGNSFMEPIGIFASKLDSEQQLYVRIDDKLNRLKKGEEYPGDDTVKDLAGYLLLLMVLREGINAD